MSERAQQFLCKVWESRDNGVDTEEQLVAFILRLAVENVRFYTAQNDLIVLDKTDLIDLSNEIENL
jgi:hypothetical protein